MRNKRCVYRSCRFLLVSGVTFGEWLGQVAEVPLSGSANAFCLNSLGLENGFSIPLACLNVIKGRLTFKALASDLDSTHF
jgi:hypothetical protein